MNWDSVQEVLAMVFAGACIGLGFSIAQIVVELLK